MEPVTRDRRVRDVHSAASWEPGLVASGETASFDDESEAAELAVVTPSFEEFYATARDNVGRALALTLHDPELAADAVDEAMARAYQHWPKVSGLDNPAGWAYRVGLNYARSKLRRRRGREDLLHGRPSHESPSIEPAIAAAVARLPARQRAVVVCRFLLGWSEAETARALHIRPGTVKSRLHRALSALQVDLEHLRQEDRR